MVAMQVAPVQYGPQITVRLDRLHVDLAYVRTPQDQGGVDALHPLVNLFGHMPGNRVMARTQPPVPQRVHLTQLRGSGNRLSAESLREYLAGAQAANRLSDPWKLATR